MLSTKRATPVQMRAKFHDRLYTPRLSNVYIHARGYVLVVLGCSLYWAPSSDGPYHEQQDTGGSYCGDNRTIRLVDCTVVTTSTEARIQTREGEVVDRYDATVDSERLACIQAIFDNINGNVWLLSTDSRKPEYLLHCPTTGEYIVTTAPAVKYSYDFHVYKGRPGSMQQVDGKIRVDRYRDGGTTMVDCDKHKWGFCCPARSHKNPKPTAYFGDKSHALCHVETQDAVQFCATELRMDVSNWTLPTLRASPLTPM